LIVGQQAKILLMTEVEISSSGETEALRRNSTFIFLVIFLIVALIGMLSGLTFNYIHAKSQDNLRKADLSYISSKIHDYYKTNNYFPTLNQINSLQFDNNIPGGIDRNKFKDPSGSKEMLLAVSNISGYTYQALPVDCNNSNRLCLSYRLSAVLSNGKAYIINSH
jgi:hypothetical protein